MNMGLARPEALGRDYTPQETCRQVERCLIWSAAARYSATLLSFPIDSITRRKRRHGVPCRRTPNQLSRKPQSALFCKNRAFFLAKKSFLCPKLISKATTRGFFVAKRISKAAKKGFFVTTSVSKASNKTFCNSNLVGKAAKKDFPGPKLISKTSKKAFFVKRLISRAVKKTFFVGSKTFPAPEKTNEAALLAGKMTRKPAHVIRRSVSVPTRTCKDTHIRCKLTPSLDPVT